jgi:hypothetical protein
MRLQQWKANGWLQAHQTTPSQIAGLLAVVERDLDDSMRNSSNWQENAVPPSPRRSGFPFGCNWAFMDVEQLIA